MRIVLYDLDLEPLTILEIQHWRRFDLPVGDPINVPVMPDFAERMRNVGQEETCSAFEYVTIRFERLVRGSAMSWMAFTGNAEAALRLRAAFLPGQQSDVQRLEREAFKKGFVSAIEAVLFGGRP